MARRSPSVGRTFSWGALLLLRAPAEWSSPRLRHRRCQRLLRGRLPGLRHGHHRLRGERRASGASESESLRFLPPRRSWPCRTPCCRSAAPRSPRSSWRTRHVDPPTSSEKPCSLSVCQVSLPFFDANLAVSSNEILQRESVCECGRGNSCARRGTWAASQPSPSRTALKGLLFGGAPDLRPQTCACLGGRKDKAIEPVMKVMTVADMSECRAA